MSSRDAPFGVTVALLAARDYAVDNGGIGVLLWSVPLRACLQTAFLTLLGGYLGGTDGRDFAYVGAVGFAMTTPLLIKITDVLVADRWQGTLYRLRMGRLPVPLVVLLRSAGFVVEAGFAAMSAAVITGPLLVGPELTLRVVTGVPLLLVASFGLLALGLTVAASAVGRRADVLLANAATLVVLLGAGVLPYGAAGLDAVASVLPLRHGLSALRRWLAGEPWMAELGLDVLVGCGWLAAAWAVLTVQERRARRHGLGDYA
ncbi:MAG: ABC transporter permease [Micromonosporaceae bacterium]